jgi:hypothetical protein
MAHCRGFLRGTEPLTSILLILLLLLPLGVRPVAGQARSDEKGPSGSGDAPVFVSSPKPLHGDLRYELTEDLRIGSESDPQKLFYIIKDIDADTAGNIYVVDADNFRIQVFDPSGRYIRTVGRKGQGPGEFQRPDGIALDEARGRMLVIDRRLSLGIFDLSGRFRDSLLVGNMQKIFTCRDGNYLAILLRASEDEMTYAHALCRLDSAGHIISKIDEHPFLAYVKKFENGATAFGTNGFELGLRLAKLADGTFASGYSGIYEVTILDADGKALRRFRKEAPPPQFTAEERRNIKNVHEKKPYFFELLTDSLDRIYVQRNMAYGKVRVEVRDKEVDVFDKTGRFLYRTWLPANTKVIRDGCLYCWEVNEEEGMEYVKRYRIRNWDKIVQAK